MTETTEYISRVDELRLADRKVHFPDIKLTHYGAPVKGSVHISAFKRKDRNHRNQYFLDLRKI